MDRRAFMKRGSALAAFLAAGGIAACSSDDEDGASTGSGSDDASGSGTGSATADDTGNTTGTTTDEAMTGGTVRVGLLGSPIDTLNPTSATSNLTYVALFSLYDSLVLLKGDQFEYQAAESLEPNGDGSEWTIVLREGITFHDGTPMTAADVIYSMNLYASSPNLAQFYAAVDLAGLTAVDDRTITVPLVSPRSDLVESVLSQASFIVPDGFEDWETAVGSGPFMLESWDPGVGAALVANPDYWGGAPSLDGVELTSIADAATRANALTSGEIDYASGLDAAAAATLEGADGIQVLRGGPTNSTLRCFMFNKTIAPFDDPRVIEACKLAVDRQQMIDVVAFGNATIGNDMPSLGFDGYPDDVPQIERDVERATELFAEAGVTEFTIRAADFLPGIVAAAELFVEQLAECGVTATVDVGDPATYFADFAQVLTTPCQSFYWINRPAITLLTSATGSAAAFNVLGSGDPDYDAAMAEAVATVDLEAREPLVAGLLEAVRDNEGWLIWGFEDVIDAAVTGLGSTELTQSIPTFDDATLG